jgi:hypothetical protein
MFLTRKNNQKRVKIIQTSTDNHSSFDGLIQENIDLSDIYQVVPYAFSEIKNIQKFALSKDEKFKILFLSLVKKWYFVTKIVLTYCTANKYDQITMEL